MKFVIEKLGFAEFKRRWEEAYVAMGHARPSHEPIALLEYQDRPVPLIMPTSNGATSAVTPGNGLLFLKMATSISVMHPMVMPC